MLFDEKEEALNFISYHKPNEEQQMQHSVVHLVFQKLLNDVWEAIPAGPGKVIFIRALNDARMKANSAISNQGK